MQEPPADLSALEPDQLVAATVKPLGRAKLSRGALWMLALLRLYVLIAVPLVIYAFFHALGSGKP